MDFLMAIILLTAIVIAGTYWNEILAFFSRKKNLPPPDHPDV
jgi:hypothetical protein